MYDHIAALRENLDSDVEFVRAISNGFRFADMSGNAESTTARLYDQAQRSIVSLKRELDRLENQLPTI